MKQILKKTIILNKEEGETPLEALENFRKNNKKYKDLKMTYAGRLDPMASGLLIVLVGEEIKNKEKYLALEKEYKFKILFGFATDTYDILGKIVNSKVLTNIRISNLEKEVKESLKHFKGKFIQQYPLYSSKTVSGKQLFSYGREGIEIELPLREVFIKKIQLEKIEQINNKKLLANIEKRIKKVKGDFRQEEVLAIWQKNLTLETLNNYFVASFIVKCSSGTYVRGIANSLGKNISIPALAYSIKRTKVGKFDKIQ